MNQSASHLENPSSQTALSPPTPVRRPRWLFALLLLVVVALAYRVAHDRALRHHDPLRGNLEETPVALDDVLSKTPAAERRSLLLTYAHDSCPALRNAALDRLSEQSDAQVTDLLEQAFRDSDSKVRETGIQELPGMDPKRGMRLLLCALHDDDTWIREAAILKIKALLKDKSNVVNDKVVPNLIATLDDPDSAIPQTAMNVLRTVTRHNWYAPLRADQARRQKVVNQWKQWWSGVRATWPTDPAYASAAALAPTRTDPCPDFSLYSLDGRSVTLQGQRNHITLLDFWGRACGPCIAETPSLVEMDRRYRSRQVDVIGIQIGQGDNTEAQEINAIRDWCRDHGVTYTQTIAPPAVREDFGDIHDVPVTVLLDRQGRIRYRWEGGPREPEVFSAAIERLLRE